MLLSSEFESFVLESFELKSCELSQAPRLRLSSEPEPLMSRLLSQAPRMWPSSESESLEQSHDHVHIGGCTPFV